MLPCFSSVFRIVTIMAPLAQGSQILGSAVLWCVVKMGDSKHYLNDFPMAVIYHRMVDTATKFTTVIGTLENLLTYLFPIFWITIFVLRLYWHFSIFY